MKKKIERTLVCTTSFILIFSQLFACNSCTNRNDRLNRTNQEKQNINKPQKPGSKSTYDKINKVTFYLENSGSMLGYVKQTNDFKNAIISLAYLPEFDLSTKEFYFVNGTTNPNKGSNLSINFIGTDPDLLKNNLNQNSFKSYGDPKFSDLARMFEMALGCAKGGDISILISDCIYDVGEESDPLTSLRIETEKTKKIFRDRLTSENIQTIIIKANSKFDGQYCFASKKGSQIINQKRPYYILIFGRSELLNKYFTEENISKTISGYEAMVRFLKINTFNIPYQATSQNSKGTFNFDKQNKNKFTNAEKDRNGEGFQFSVATDFSLLPFPDIYLRSKDNYITNSDFTIVDITKPIKKIHDVTTFNPTHLITLHAVNSPYGNLEVTLKYIIPSWITETSTDNENNIQIDTTHTFGFKLLTDAITEAYEYKNKQQNIMTFRFEILK